MVSNLIATTLAVVGLLLLVLGSDGLEGAGLGPLVIAGTIMWVKYGPGGIDDPGTEAYHQLHLIRAKDEKRQRNLKLDAIRLGATWRR